MVGDVAPPEVGLFEVGFFGSFSYDISCQPGYLATCYLQTPVLLFGARSAIDCIIACVWYFLLAANGLMVISICLA